MEVRAVRSSGPGGQNVNKVASKVQLWIALDGIVGFEGDERERVRAALASRIGADGRLLLTSQLTRDQAKNLDDAKQKAVALIRAALHRPKPRKPTRPTRGAKERRLSDKRKRSRALKSRKPDDRE
ncbi:MAG: aminoacyl-tRNA hydrolase [Deltaproteobacteria bacterium]|nr:aminoacyl-tRNA hydrolase [Deltaproteobacteria bacterium]